MANYYKSQSGSLQCREADTCGSISSPFYLCSFFLKCSPPPLLCNHIDGVGLGPACSVGSSQTHSRGLRTDPRSWGGSLFLTGSAGKWIYEYQGYVTKVHYTLVCGTYWKLHIYLICKSRSVLKGLVYKRIWKEGIPLSHVKVDLKL